MKQISLTEGKKRETLRDLPKEVTQKPGGRNPHYFPKSCFKL